METNEQPVVVAAGPEDMIAAAWFNLGYRPRDSLLLLGLEGPRQRLGVLLRADLPRSRTPAGFDAEPRPLDQLSTAEQHAVVPRMIRDLLGTVAAGGAAGVLAIVTDEQALSCRPPTVVRVLRALRHEARALGLQLIDVLGVTSTAFGSLMCRDPRCCPPGGRPLSLVLSSRTAAVHVVNGETVAESEAALLADVTPESSAPEGSTPENSTTQRLTPENSMPENSTPENSTTERSTAETRSSWWARWVTACAEAADVPSRGEPVRGFSAALHDPCLRDAVLMDLLGATPEEVGAMLDGMFHPDPGRCGCGNSRLGPDVPEPDFGRMFRQPPQNDRLQAGRTVLAAAVRVAAGGDRAPALAVLAMLAWFEGRGGRARLLVERARADAGSVSLIGLVEDLLLRRVPPPWLRPGPHG